MKCLETILGYFHIDRAAINIDKLDSLIYIILAPSELDINSATLNEGLNTGVIGYIKSDSLKNLVYDLPSRPDKIRYYENFILEDNVNNLIPFLYERYNFRNMDSKFSPVKERIGHSAFPVSDNRELFDLLKFENLVDNQMYNYNTKFIQYTEFKEELELIRTMIKRELDD